MFKSLLGNDLRRRGRESASLKGNKASRRYGGLRREANEPKPSVVRSEVHRTRSNGGVPPNVAGSSIMSDIANIAGSLGSSRLSVQARPSAPADRPVEAPARHGRGEDAVEISEDAIRLGAARARTDDGVDLVKVARIRDEIAAGTYETDARSQIALVQLARDLA